MLKLMYWPGQRRRADAVRVIVETAAGHIREQRRETADRAQAIRLLTGLARNLEFGRQPLLGDARGAAIERHLLAGRVRA